jgi:RNA polymerase sigma-B factor
MSRPATPERRDDAAMLEVFVEYQRTGDMRLRNELITNHMRLAEYLAGRFANRGEPIDDLRQVALIGLLKAVERFDPGRGLQFTSFATPTILGEIKRHFRDRGWTVRVPRRVQELHLQLDGITNDLSQELGRPPTPGEIARRAGVREEDVLEGMEAGGLYNLGSIDSHPDEDGQPASARIGAPDPELDSLDERFAVQQMLRSLPEREQRIVYLRFYEGLTQSEIAEQVGISQMHVSRLLVKSLELMAAHAKDEGFEPADEGFEPAD